MFEDLKEQSSVKKWGLVFESVPHSIECTVLGAAQIFSQNQVIHVNEQVLRRLPIQKAVNLLRDEWVVFFRRNLGDVASSVVSTFKQACGMLKV